MGAIGLGTATSVVLVLFLTTHVRGAQSTLVGGGKAGLLCLLSETACLIPASVAFKEAGELSVGYLFWQPAAGAAEGRRLLLSARAVAALVGFLVGAAVSMAGIVGDLWESLLKRVAGVKVQVD